jgi:hypothetical protein
MEQWPAARQLLAELQLNVDTEKAIYTARGAAIDLTASLAARETVALIADVSVEVSAAIGRILAELNFAMRSAVLAPGVRGEVGVEAGVRPVVAVPGGMDIICSCRRVARVDASIRVKGGLEHFR